MGFPIICIGSKGSKWHHLLRHKHHIINRLHSTHKWTSDKVRNTFLDYFKQRDHVYVHSSSVLPKKNEGAYFINAGMNQFKPLFLGTVNLDSRMASYHRVVNSQKCIRVGGKHNDLEDVGNDTYHHTFFEMLGSWSFGDYFKEEACSMAWDLLTNVYQLHPDRLYVTYFKGSEKMGIGADEECREIWTKLGVPRERILAYGAPDNFWDMGETGPCGPCTEIHYDHVGRCAKEAAQLVNAGSPDLVEIWNLVFMTFDRHEDGTLRPLPRRHVDTGMGLERLTAVLQGQTSNYSTDLFTPLFNAIHEHSSGVPAYGGHPSDPVDVAYRIVADHARMFTVAISDGIIPGRGTRNSMVRHVVYRALRQATDVLGAAPGTLAKLVPVVVETLAPAFPELAAHVSGISDVVAQTEARYVAGRHAATAQLHKALNHYGATAMLTGQETFSIVDGRFGHPVALDVLIDVANDHGIAVDVEGFEDVVKEVAFASADSAITDRTGHIALTQHELYWLTHENIPDTDDGHKYDYHRRTDGTYEFPSLSSHVVGIFDSNLYRYQTLHATEDLVGLLLDRTCFYSEKGGQTADTGYIELPEGVRVRVLDVRTYQDYVLHVGVLEPEGATVNVGDPVTLTIDPRVRAGCMQHHTATHLLHHALRQVLGDDVTQQGSTVTQHSLSFSFSALKTSISLEEIEAISSIMSELVDQKLPVYKEEVPLSEAMAVRGLATLKDTVYPEHVRVVSVGVPVPDLLADPESSHGLSTSVELCGGTHVENTGDLGGIVITNFTGTQQGTRTVTAICGQAARTARSEGKALEEKVSQLESWIQEKTHKDRWVKAANDIEKAVSEDGHLLPKVSRDRVLRRLETLQLLHINPLKNTVVKETYRQSLDELVEASSKAVISEFTFNKLRDLVAVVASCQPHIPVMLLSAQPDLKLGFKPRVQGCCYVPTQGYDQDFTAKKWALHLTNQMDGDARPPKGKLAKHSNIYTFSVTLTDNKPLDHAIGLGKTFAALYER